MSKELCLKKLLQYFSVIGLTLTFFNCSVYQEERDITQPYKLKKKALQDGVWYLQQTVLDVPYEGWFSHRGEMGELYKIQWSIEEDYLYVYKTNEAVVGTDRYQKKFEGDNYRGQPVAAYKILKHFDVWHDYNSATGEELPVLREYEERPWYEREYIRVDWSKNHVSSYNGLQSNICLAEGVFTKTPASVVSNRPDDPNRWYVALKDATVKDGWRNIYDYQQIAKLDSFDYMEVVNADSITFNFGWLANATQMPQYCNFPEGNIDEGDGMVITYRSSFLKINGRDREFEALYYPDEVWEKFGYFRTIHRTWDPERGLTDFEDSYINRWNIWKKTFKDDPASCTQDSECGSNSHCSKRMRETTGRCTIPYNEREIKPIIYYLNAEADNEQNENVADNVIQFDISSIAKKAAESWNANFKEFVATARLVEAKGKNYSKKDLENQIANTEDVLLFAHTDQCGVKKENSEEWLYGPWPCQRLGDLRYSFMNFQPDRPGSPWGGYGPSAADPETGEIIQGVANVNLDNYTRYQGFLGDYYDLIFDRVDEQSFIDGVSPRSYFEKLGQVISPRPPQFMPKTLNMSADHSVSENDHNPQQPFSALNQMLTKLKEMKSAGITPYRNREMLKGSALEKRVANLLGSEYAELFQNESSDSSNKTDDESTLDKLSPFSNGLMDQINQIEEVKRKLVAAKYDYFESDTFLDLGLEKLFRDYLKKKKPECANHPISAQCITALKSDELLKHDTLTEVIKRILVGVILHEMGHTFGLMHNFEGSVDEINYQDGFTDENGNYQMGYWEINKKYPLPDIEDYLDVDSDNDGQQDSVSAENYQQYWQKYLAVKQQREAVGVDFVQYSAIMEYYRGQSIQTDLTGLGKYDKAAIKFGYGMLHEAWEGGKPNELKQNRISLPYYQGGENCKQDNDCPYHQFGQRCLKADVLNPQITTGRDGSCKANERAYQNPVCSTFEQDHATAGGVKTPSGYCELKVDRQFPKYRYCSDYRTADKPFCNMSDHGRSSTEIVENTIEKYERSYIMSNFRRYQRYFSLNNYYSNLWSNTFKIIGKQYASFLYHYFYDPEFQTNTGPGGMRDMMMASVMGLEFFKKILTTPDTGQYLKISEEDKMYESFAGSFESEPGRCMKEWSQPYGPCVPMGMGKRLWTSYESGELGQIRRLARIGTYYDKQLALHALSNREWGQPQAIDETYPVNYYDAFKEEVMNLFSDIITGNDHQIGPYFIWDNNHGQNHQLVYAPIWSGKFLGGDIKNWGIQLAGPQNTTSPYANEWRVNPTLSIYTRINAMVYALANFPVYFDETFPNYIKLNAFKPGENYDPDLYTNEEKFVVYDSPSTNMKYVAIKTKDQLSITAKLVERAGEFLKKREWVEDEKTSGSDIKQAYPFCSMAGYSDNSCRTYVKNRINRELEDLESMLIIIDEYNQTVGYSN